MNFAVKMSGAAFAMLVLFTSAEAATRRVLVREVSYRWLTVPAPLNVAGAVTGDWLYRSCRSKIRRELGPARGRHTLSLRLAFAERCVASGGKSW